MGLFDSIGGLFGLNSPDTGGLGVAAAEAKDLYKQMYDESIARGEPFLNLGTEAASALGQRLGLTGDSESSGYGQLLQGFSPSRLTDDPGYLFRQEQGNKALERSLASQGKTLSPEATQAYIDYNQGMASQEYGDAFDRNRATQSDIFNRLYGVTGQGQQQSQFQSGLGQDYAGNMADIGTSLADSELAARDAGAARRSSFFSNLIGSAATAAGGGA